MEELIHRGSQLPAEKRKMFTTFVDDQEAVKVKIFEGEEALAKDNHFLDEFRLEGLLPAKKGVPKIEVVYAIDTNGILTVAAKSEVNGVFKEANIVITGKKTSIESDEPAVKRSRVA